MRNWFFADQSTYVQTLVNSLSVGIAIFEDREFRLLAANAAYKTLLEPQPHHKQNAQLRDMVPPFVQADCLAIFKQTAQTRTAAYGEAITRQAATGALTSWNWTLTPLAGAVGYLLLTVHEVTIPGSMQQGEPTVHTDLLLEPQEMQPCPSSLRESDEHLLQSHITPSLACSLWSMSMNEERQRWAAILDQLPEGVLLVEATTSIIHYANAMAIQLLGLPASQLLGVPLNQVALATPQQPRHFEGFTHWNFALIRALSGETVPNEEVLVNRPDGSQAVMFSSVSPIRTIQGRITEAVIVFQDITAQKTLEQQKQEFFVVAHHELRTPLTAILGFAELLQAVESDSGNQRRLDALERIQQEGVRLRVLLHELLDVSRLDHARLDIQQAPHDLLDLVQELVEKYRATVRTHHFRLTIQDASHLLQFIAWIDRLRIEQTLENLLSNAAKYSPAGRVIEMGLRRQEEEALIWVRDQGHGIASHDLPRIFERFYRGVERDPSTSGFGVGLFLAKTIIQEHGGHIWAESTLGQGSTFFVRLPLGQRF
ncbi:MAG TPA: ATP-binding protein [Ktedonosporobacter sp.]|jgi:PAS domain S-box-containing protein|nr:ATP-binding protein [Ktedonosporobacter sp.]